MKDYTIIRHKCAENSDIAAKVIDEYIIYFAASRNNLEKRMEQDFARFRHITRSFPEELTNRLKAQYLAHKVFKENGLINKFLGHPDLKRLNPAEFSFLQFQAEHPWRFSFAVIIDNPADDFYMMEDVFTSEQYLLYSPGVTDTLGDFSPQLWFNTIAFNGECWQSYGVIASYQSFGPDDIYFFATEVNRSISDETDLLRHLEDDPLPYMMLINGQRMPLIVHNDDQLVQAVSEYEPESFDNVRFQDEFVTEFNEGVYRLALKDWDGPPHHSIAYYDEHTNTLLLSAMTDRGYSSLAAKLNSLGYDVSPEPFVRVGLPMVSTAENILRRKINLLPNEDLFLRESTPQEKENLNRINKVIEMIIPEINAGRVPDPEKLASLAGTDVETVKNIIEQLRKKK